MIGQCWGIVNIENCTVDADIDIQKEYSAGFIGKSYNGEINISGCTAKGTINTSAKYAAGFVSKTDGACNITDCLSSLTIDSSVDGEGIHGGIIGIQGKRAGASIKIKGCVFNGSLLGEKTTCCGGFVGWRNKALDIYDSIFDPASITVSDTDSAMFVRNLGDTHNSYYLYSFGEDSGDQWKQGYSVTAGESAEVDLADISENYQTGNIKAGSTGIRYNGVIYAGAGENVSLTLHSTPDKGKMLSEYLVDEGTLTGEENLFGNQQPYTLEMPADNVLVTATFKDKPMIVGDVNLDSATTIFDVTVIQRYLVDLITLDDDQIALANTNGDKSIDISDATDLQLFIAELIPKLADLTPPTIFPTEPVPTTTAPPPVENIIQFVDNEFWGTVYVYAKNSDGDELCGAWPGTRITNTTLNEFDETLFIIAVPVGTSSIVLNNGVDKQTEEITYFDVTGYYLTGDIDDSGHYEVDWWIEDEE